MTVPSGAALIHVGNANTTVQTAIPTHSQAHNPQSLVISPFNGDLYMLQVLESNEEGQLTLNRYTGGNGSWAVDSYMYLNGFGHGVAFGIWRYSVSLAQHFFTEWDVNSGGRGQELTSFLFSEEGTISYPTTVTGQQVYSPTGGLFYTCVVDPTNTFVVIRINGASGFYYQAYNIINDAEIDFSHPLISGGLPEYSGDDSGDSTFEGYTVAGHYLYTLFQTSVPDPTTGLPVITGYIRSYDMNFTENNADGYIAVADHGHPTEGEFEGITFGDTHYALYFMIAYKDSESHYVFNLHGIAKN
jgi:hypothetical protein